MPYTTNDGFRFWNVIAFLVRGGVTVRVCNEGESWKHISLNAKNTTDDGVAASRQRTWVDMVSLRRGHQVLYTCSVSIPLIESKRCHAMFPAHLSAVLPADPESASDRPKGRVQDMRRCAGLLTRTSHVDDLASLVKASGVSKSEENSTGSSARQCQHWFLPEF
jgi:hypothetical protein